MRCDHEAKGGEGDQPWRTCPACHFAMHVFPRPETKEGEPKGGWMCVVGNGLGTFWPWGALPVAKETPG